MGGRHLPLVRDAADPRAREALPGRVVYGIGVAVYHAGWAHVGQTRHIEGRHAAMHASEAMSGVRWDGGSAHGCRAMEGGAVSRLISPGRRCILRRGGKVVHRVDTENEYHRGWWWLVCDCGSHLDRPRSNLVPHQHRGKCGTGVCGLDYCKRCWSNVRS